MKNLLIGMYKCITALILMGLITFNSSIAGTFIAYQTPTDTTKADSIKKQSEKLPLDPGRIVEFNTNEGTWMSLDISPDGKHIVFDLMGDLYRIPAEGGEAEQLTDGMAFDTHPRYSPDGKYLLYTSDADGEEDLYYMNLEDSSDVTQLTKGENTHFTSAEWTPDGEYVVASKGGRMPKLWLIHKDGGKGASLVSEPTNLKITDPAVSPDGRYIYFSQRNGAWNYNAQLPQYQIGVYDREDGSRRNLTSRYGSAFTPVVSDDGKWLVYGSRYESETGLVLRDLETGDEKWLAYPVQRDEQESIAAMGVLPGMTFTPDNKHVLASYGGKIHRIPVEGGEATVIPFEVNAHLEMGPEVFFKYPISDDKEILASQIRDAVPSPNGKQLVFTALNKLYIQNLPDGEPKRLTNSEEVEAQPEWSPDGKWIAYATYSAENGGNLYKLNPNARRIRPEKLTDKSAIYTSPAWSRNSDRIVALRGDNRSYEQAHGPFAFGSTEDIVWVSAKGGETNFIAKSSGRDNPHFVSSNDRIYLNRGNGILLSIRWDGTDEKEHVKITGITTAGFNEYGAQNFPTEEELHPDMHSAKENNPPSNADIITMAPDGDQALAQINNEIYVVTVPKTGGTTPAISVANPSNAQFPAKKLTQIGGQFPTWSGDAGKVHWSIGRGHFIYDLEDAKAHEDSVKAAKKLEEEKKKEEADKEEKEEGEEKDEEEQDSEDEEKSDKDEEDEEKEDDKYKPQELSIEVTVTRDIPSGTMLLKNARIITMNGDEVLENGDVLIENNRIKEVGTNLSAPGAEEMDLQGKTVVPGFIDTHAHMWPNWGIHKQRVWIYAANLAYGVTTTRDPQTATTDVLTYADMVETGSMEGPRVYSTGPGLGFWGYNIQSLKHAKDVMKQYSKYYDTKTIKMYIAGNRKQRQWILMAAREQNIMPTTEGALNWKLNMTQLLDGYPGHEHSFPVYPIYKDVVQTTAQAKMAVTPTLLVSYGGPWAENYYYSRENPFSDAKLRTFTPYEELASKSLRRPGWFHDDEHVFQKHAVFMKDLVEADGLAGVGSHGQLQGLGFHWELWSVAAGGMTNHDALKVATIHGAKAIGLDDDLGTLEAGKLADLIILDQNPLDDLRNTNTIHLVMKNGRLYEGATLNQVYPDKKEAGDFEWEQPNPKNLSLPGVER